MDNQKNDQDDKMMSNESPVVSSNMSKPPKQFLKLSLKTWLIIIGLIVLAAIAAVVVWQLNKKDGSTSDNTSSTQNTTPKESQTVTSGEFAGLLQFDTSKDYGNKYADGILPVGDSKYVTDGAKKGYVYVCSANFVPEGQAGASSRGPWFIGTDQWDVSKKISVKGSVSWTSKLSNTIEGSKRTLTTNDLPTHKTGTFPISSSDPAYSYDRNPNSISEQDLTYSLTASPSVGDPQCLSGGEIGIMLTGVALFDAFDAGGRDAGAWETQDSCQGHPQEAGIYHYHSLSSCITDVNIDTVIGFALDGFPITGPKISESNILTTDDLDECHGIVSEINLDGKKTTTYHYVMTQDFPYSASCFRATAVRSPAAGNGGQAGSGQSQQSGTNLPPKKTN